MQVKCIYRVILTRLIGLIRSNFQSLVARRMQNKSLSSHRLAALFYVQLQVRIVGDASILSCTVANLFLTSVSTAGLT